MMPAEAQVIATFSMPTEPPSSAFTNPEFQNPRTRGNWPVNHSYATIAVSRCMNDSATVVTVAQNTDNPGE